MLQVFQMLGSKRQKTSQKFVQVIIVLTLTLCLVSCVCTQTAKTQPIPKIEPPLPVDEQGKTVWQYDPETDSVILPFWYWQKVFDYIADTQAILR